uniref:BTB domain-containing protein n=1 Tax=Parastrongyloides trichosuri TaxID=131310 RepID=A0A0N4ZUN7_PARTI
MDSINSNEISKPCKIRKLDELKDEGDFSKYIKTSKPNEGSIKLCIRNVADLNKRVYSPITFINNIPWQILVLTTTSERKNNQKYLGIYIVCNSKNDSFLWSCFASIEIRLKSSANDDADMVENFKCVFRRNENSRGYASFIKWDTLISESNNYIKDGSVNIEATIKIENVTGVREKVAFDFSQPGNLVGDTIINIDGVKIHTNKDYLSLFSPVLRKLFYSDFAESNMEEIPLKEIDVKDFVELLEVIYPSHKEITKENVEILLKLGDRFDITYVVDKCEKFLMDSDKIPFELKFSLSDTYRLSNLHNYCLSKIKNGQDAKNFMTSKEYENVSDAFKIALLEKIKDLL